MTNELQFGLEIEMLTPDSWPYEEAGREQLAKILREAGFQAKAESYNHEDRPHWKLTTDQSIGYFRGIELVSPILRGEESLQEIVKILKILNQNKMKVSTACGVHVHIGVPDNAPIGFFKNLVRFYQEYEPLIDQMMPNSRRGEANSYIKSIRQLSKSEINSATCVEDLRRAFQMDRYYKLNLEAFWAHGTVEFRHHSGTLQSSKIISWIRICMAMVQKALDLENFPQEILESGVARMETQTVEVPPRRLTVSEVLRRRRTRYTENQYVRNALEYVLTHGYDSHGFTQADVNERLGSTTWGDVNTLLQTYNIPFHRERHGRSYVYHIIAEGARVEQVQVPVSVVPSFVPTWDSFMNHLGLEPLVRSYIDERVAELNS